MFEKIRDLVAEQLGVNKDDIKPESRFKEDLNADSLDLFELIMRRNIQQKFLQTNLKISQQYSQ